MLSIIINVEKLKDYYANTEGCFKSYLKNKKIENRKKMKNLHFFFKIFKQKKKMLNPFLFEVFIIFMIF